MTNQVANQQTTNIVPVQGVFDPEPTFAIQYFVGPAGTPFFAPIGPTLNGKTITNSTIDSSVIGSNSPAAAYFTTAQVAATPTADQDVANKAYVDSVAQGLDIKASCLYTTTGNITLSGLGTQANGDWPSTLTAGDRILVKNQTDQAQNGIYAAASSGWMRTADMNNWAEVPGAFTFIENGATLSSTGWVTTAGSTGTIGVTNMPWTQFSGAGTYTAGNGLQLISNAFSVKLNGTSLDASASGLRISTTYAGQTSITTLGTIGTGVWQATDVGVLHGGTGASDAAGARANLSAAILGANNDITSMSAITGSIATPTYIQFNTTQTPLPTDATGRLYYNNDDQFKTLSFQMNGNAVQKIGEELYYRIKCQGAITRGQVVSFAGTLGASGGLIGKAATGLTKDQSYYILGIAAETGNNNDWIFVTTFGEVKQLNTTGGAEAWVQGQELYYNPSVTGGLTKTKPAVPNAIAVVAAVVHVGTSNGILFVRPTFGSVLGGTDGNVQFGTLNNLDVIQYNSTGQYWQNVAASSLSVSYAATAGSAGSATTATTATNLAGGATGSVPYQTGAGATTFLGLGTLNYIMTAGASAPGWTNPASITVGNATNATSATTATNLAGGAAASIPYQTGAGATSFIASVAGDAGKVLQSNGASAPSWVTPVAYATVTDDTTTNATRYPLFANQTAGNLSTVFASSTKYQFNPSTGVLTATGFSGSGANLTSLPAGQLSGTIPSGVLGNSSLFVGTTSIALNRTSASQSLTGVSIDGSAGSATTAGTATNANNIAITDNTSSTSTYYPILSLNSTGNNAATTSSTKLSFVPSTGVLSVTSFSGAGTGLTGTASSLSIGGNAATATSAGKWTTARNLAGNSVDGSANVAFSNKFIVQGTTDAGLSGAQFLGALGTGIVKNTTTTGVLSIAVAGDFPTLNQNTTGSAGSLSSTLAVSSGGTGQTTYTDGQLLIGNSTGNTLAKATLTAGSGISITNGSGAITIAATGSGGTVTSVGMTVPSFLSVSGSPITGSGTLAVSLSGTALPVANGGTGQTTKTAAFDALSPLTTLGDTIYFDGTDNVRLAGNTTTTRQFLRQTGTGTVSAAPAWDTVTKTDVGLSNVENTALSTWAGSANITTLGTIATGTWNATTIAVSKGGTGLTTIAALSIPVANTLNTYTTVTATAGQSVRVNAGGTAWEAYTPGTGTVTSVTGTSPVVSSGGNTPAISLASGYGDTQNPYASKTANFFLAAPNGTAGVPSFRAIVAADIPTLNQNTTGTATNATNTAITDDTTTNADMYPTWVTANTGNLPQKVTSTKLKFNPSTGVLTTTGGIGGGAF